MQKNKNILADGIINGNRHFPNQRTVCQGFYDCNIVAVP
jgi:hypothetical protein